MNSSKLGKNVIMGSSDEQEEQIQQNQWGYEEDPYQASGKAICAVDETFRLKKDLRFPQDKNTPQNIVKKAEALYRYTNDLKLDRNKSCQQVIYDGWVIECEKTTEYNCESENSQDDEIQFQPPNCDDIMSVIETERQEGKMYFVAKIVAPVDQQFKIEVQRIKGAGNDPVTVKIIEKRDIYYLFKLSMTSQVKVFKIKLVLGNETILESKPFNFSVERMEYNIGLAYDFVKNKKLSMSMFEGVIASSSFNIADGIDFFENSVKKLEERSRSYLNQEIEFDKMFENFLTNQKNLQKWLLQFQLILKSPESMDEKVNFYKKPVIQKIANYFMKFMLRHELKINEQKRVTSTVVEKLIKTYLQVFTIEKISNQNFNLLRQIDSDQLNKKVSLFIEFLIHQKKFNIVYEHIMLEINHNLNVVHKFKGLDSFIDIILESNQAYDESYVNLVAIFLFYFIRFTNVSSQQLIRSLNKIFSQKLFHWGQNQNQQQRDQKLEIKNRTINYLAQIATKIRIQNLSDFQILTKLINTNKVHQYLKPLFENQTLLDMIEGYSQILIRQTQRIKDQQQLKKTILILVDYCFNNLESRLNKLKLLNDKVLKNSIKSKNSQLQCELAHKMILNPLLKNFSRQMTETIKNIEKDISSLVAKKMDFNQTSSFINKCFDISIISSPGSQEIYQKFLLDQIYKSHFTKDNAENFEGLKGEYKFWHNQFSYNFVINSYILQNVVKILLQKTKDNRAKDKIIKSLKTLIDNGICPKQQKENLKFIVELDNIELTTQFVLKIISQERQKLFVLKKIQADKNQQLTLQSIILELIREFGNEQIPGKVYMNIQNSTQYEKSLIERVFGNNGIIGIIEEKNDILCEILEKLQKIRSFIDILNKKYELSDYERISSKLLQSQNNMREKQLKFKDEIVSVLSMVDEKILKSYSFGSFFVGQEIKKITFEQAIKRCLQLQKKLIDRRNRVIQQFNDNQLTYGSVEFLKDELKREKQLRQFFMIQMNGQETNVADGQMVKELLKTFSLIEKVPFLSKIIKGVIHFIGIDQTGKLTNLNERLKDISNYYDSISAKNPTTNISKLSEKYNQFNKIIQTFKFNKTDKLSLENKKSLNLLEFFYEISTIKPENLDIILQIGPQIDNLKEKCQEDQENFTVEYDDLLKAQAMIGYIKNVYNPYSTNFKSLIKETSEIMANLPSLRLSHKVFKKIDQLIHEFKNVHKGDVKTVEKIYQIMQKCQVDLRFDQENHLSISLIIDEVMRQKKGEQKRLSQQQIKNLQYYTINQMSKNNQKQKTQQQMKKITILEKFNKLLNKIDEIKKIWNQLQGWGYIVFRKNNSSPLDQRIRIQLGNHETLNNYVQKYEQICQKWIYQMKELQKISPKTTLLQGQSVRQFYQVLTNQKPQKKIRFLNICEIQTLDEYINIKRLRQTQHPEEALDVIKQFFQHLKIQDTAKVQRLPDWGQSYIKTVRMSEQKNDFFKGLMEIDPARIKNLDMTKILICVEDTTQLDIKTFIETAMRDETSEYVIIRPEKLSKKNQQFIIKNIQQHKKANEKISLKLCQITSSYTEALDQYLKNNFTKKQQPENKQARQIQYKKFILSKLQNVQIVKSTCPGFGKTSYIVEKSKKANRKCVFFPLAGSPSSAYIYKRFEQACQEIYKTYRDQKRHCSFILQIHNIDPEKFQIINTFLQQLITGRCIRYNGQFPQIIKETNIFIELENFQPINKFNPLKTFTFLQEINQFSDKLVYQINQRPPINFNLWDEKKTQYIVQHLDYFDNVDNKNVNLLDKDQDQQKNLKPYSQFKPQGLNVQKANKLMKKYFFDIITDATYYQYQYFCSLFFSVCNTFSSSFGLSFYNLKNSYDKYYTQKLGLSTIRSGFFQVVLKNCRQFIGKQISYGQFDYQKASLTQQRLKQIPFLIIPNTDGESFSFIYKDHKTVPPAVRNFYISQDTELVKYILKENLEDVFEKHSIKKLQEQESKLFDEKIEQILCNISGSRKYTIKKDPNYVVNIDNFFKMCLITLRQRQNIPITIMGEAGTGKTAILKHVSEQLYEHEFMTLNVNAGTKVEDIRNFLTKVEQKHKSLKGTKKIWIFFDEFNTLKQVGYMKEIIIEKRFQGKQLPFLKDVVIMAACNPFRKLKPKNQNEAQVKMAQPNEQKEQKKPKEQALAFHVLPPPHSMIECMWNFGALSSYEYQKYISKMISNVEYKNAQTTKLLLDIHEYLADQFDSSFVSLRDIQRFRTIYEFFNTKLPLNAHKNTAIYIGHDKRDERALIMSFIFCYTLRIQSEEIKKHLYSMIEKGLNLTKGFVEKVKSVQETDFFHRLKIDYGSIAANSAIKENIYCFFVAIYNRLPMIIVGPPGCSKSLAIRILVENMKGYNSEDKYLTEFQSVRPINFQGSELCTSKQVQSLFEKAKGKNNKDQLQGNQTSLRVLVFDEIGLADKSKQNPLKVIHPYLEVGRGLNLNDKEQKQRNYAFLGISNTDLDISKMSRMLVLRRPQPSDQQLRDTAIGIARSFEYGRNEKILNIIQKISLTFFDFIEQWHNLKNFNNFFSLRDFYSLIKYFLGTCQQRQVNINEDQELTNLLKQAIFKNLNGGNNSVELFMKNYCRVTQKAYKQGEVVNRFDLIKNITECLQKQNLRFPLVLAKDQESLSYLINLFQNKFKKTTYFEKSPFSNDKGNTSYIIQSTASIINTVSNGNKLILNNIQPTIQTSLYDMLNKFYIIRGDQKYCRISNVQSGMTKKTLVHNDFNCIFFLLTDNLVNVEAPFLSRFEKYSFSMENISHYGILENLIKQVQNFKKSILQICKTNNMSHYKIDRFFNNCEKESLKTLILRIINESNLPIPEQRSQQEENYKKIILNEVIFEMVMNSSQDFIILYQYVLSKQIQLSTYNNSIKRAIEKKKSFKVQEATETILFTTDKNVVYSSCQKLVQQAIIKLDLQVIKTQNSFDESVKNFLNSKQEKIIFIQIQIKNLNSIQYLISEVQKIKLQESVSKNKTFQDKRIIFFFQLNRQQNQNDQKAKGVSFLCQYRQIFYQGKFQIEAIKYNRDQFFNNILDLTTVLTHVQEFFNVEIKSKDQAKNPQILNRFKSIFNQLKTDKTNVLHRHLEEFIEKTEGINLTIQQSMIKEILQNPELLKNTKNFKQALTKQLSSKSYYGVVSFFLKYLFEVNSLLTYSKTQIHNLNAVEFFKLSDKTRQFIENAKQSQVYQNNLKLLTSKKINFLKNQYKKFKMMKRLPSLERKFTAEIEIGRFVHFSKLENQMILSKENDSLSTMALNIFGKQNNFQKELKVFKQQIYKKSSLVFRGEGQNQGENLYNSINKDSSVKELFIMELLIDMLQKKGINPQHIEVYMKILKLLVNFESSNQTKSLDIEFMIFILLALEQQLMFTFKLFSVFYDKQLRYSPSNDFFKTRRITEIKNIDSLVCKQFFSSLIKEIFSPLFKDYNSIRNFGGSVRYFEIFTNSMLQIQNLEKLLKLQKPLQPILISIRDVSRFVSEFSEQHKYELLQEFIKKLNSQKSNPNIYSITFNFVQNLYIKSQNPEEKSLILKFQANKIFLQWFKDRPDDKDCLESFIKKCQSDSTFCQNSMHVINYLLNYCQISYDDIASIEDSLHNAPNQLHQIAKLSKQKGFQNNLCIVMVNIFLQKLIKQNKGKSHQQIVHENKQFFSSIYNRLSVNDISSPLYQIFLFTFVKFVTISYAQGFITDQVDQDISALLDRDSNLSENLRFFCTKMFRKHLTPRQIKDRFIKIKRMHWAPKIENDFAEDNARSLIVPKDFCNAQLSNIFVEIQKTDGSAFNLFEQMLQYSDSFEDRYSILNFFMRYYYTYSYNDKVYKEKTIQHFNSIKGKFQEKLGKVETQLISRYLDNKVSQHYKAAEANSVNEDDIIPLNFFNLFLASKKSISPLHSLFIQNGQLSGNIENLVKQQFSLSGPQNPFISNAINTLSSTRNNNIGVYICCNDCDYIYTHQNCGWPNQQTNCPMCGQKIGGSGGHKLCRIEEGARRLMHNAFVDKPAYYVGNLKELQQYWQVQRKYIEFEINRMKLKRSFTIKLRKQTFDLTGLKIVDSGRISSFSFNILSTLLETLSYFFISLKVINQQQVKTIFGDDSSQIALNRLDQTIKQTNNRIKSPLNIGNKFHGWMFGVQRNFILDMNSFPIKFQQYQNSLANDMEKLKSNLNLRINEKKVKQDYLNLYIEFVKTINQGYFLKQVSAIKDYTASNQFTRDYAQKLFEKLVSLNTDDKKFDFSAQYQSLQGKMQFPFDIYLTEDKIDQKRFNYYKIFKLPDQQIGYHDIVVKYQPLIKERYPFLDYILKQSDLFIQMKNFYNVISFVNELQKQVNNRYERTKGEQPLINFIQELKQEQGNNLNKKLKQYKVMIESWKKLAGFLGVLQNQCKVIGKMNDDCNQQTELKAFLLDQSTKQNVYGLMIASIFHNFAKMHNESMAVLNSRKNQIKSYKSLNLFNELQKLHPQKIQLEQIYTLDEQELKKSLEQCSVASIAYGQNYIYHNFDAYEEYFLKKLEGKCEIISNLRQFVSVCYNGEAFSAQSEGSATLTEIREILDEKLTGKSLEIVSLFIKTQKDSQNFQKSIVKIRGDLEKVMLILNTLKGNYSKERNLTQIINEIEISVSSQELKNGQLSQIPIPQIVDLYERLQDELMYNVIKRLPEKYKEKLEKEIVQQVQQSLNSLPKEENDQKPTIQEFESALMKFTSRTLQNGIFDAEKLVIQFVANRADFWPKGYSDDKISALMYQPALLKIKICHVMSLIELIHKVKKIP